MASITSPSLIRAGTACLGGAAVGAGLLVLNASIRSSPWAPSYLAVWLFVLGLSVGAMAMDSVHRLTGGRWGVTVAPFFEASLRSLPIVVLLAVPLLFRLADLYPWMREPSPEQRWYLNPAFFAVRAVAYFLIWLGLAWRMRGPLASRTSLPRWAQASGKGVPAASLLLNALVTTFASIDWIMSLTPHWHSTVFGLLMGTAQALGALAAAIVITRVTADASDEHRADRFHDLGKLLFALVLLWAYLSFMQYLITWSEDLPDDIGWYLPRTRTSWAALTLFVVGAFFALPFVTLLSSAVKRRAAVLAVVAAVVLLGRLGDSFWLVLPTFDQHGLRIGWNALFALVAVGGVWLWALLRALAAVEVPRAAPAL